MTAPAPAQPRWTTYVPLAGVVRAELNPKEHDLELVKGSIRRFGFVDGAVHDSRTDRILAGHGRLEALLEMQASGEAPPDGIVAGPDGWLMPLQMGYSSRSDSEAEALLIVLNKATEAGGWNIAELAAALEAIRQNAEEAQDPELFGLTGFSFEDLAGFQADLANDAYDADDDKGDLDDVPEVPVVPFSTEGDVWLLGRHRLVCGSAADSAAVDAALGGEPAAMMFTDPPYGVSYKGAAGTIINDDLAADDLGRLLVDSFRNAHRVLLPGGAFYVCSPSGNLETTFRLALGEVKLTMRSQIVWVKDRFVLGRADYHGGHETILYGWQLPGEPEVPPHFDPEHDTVLYGWKDGAAHTFEGGRKQSTVWIYPRPAKSDLHPTMKPIALCRRAVLNSTRPGKPGRVLDLFGGSGSTLIACEVSARSASLVELDPKFVDVIARRWQEHTGGVPVLERTGEAHDFTVAATPDDAPLPELEPVAAAS